MSYHWTDNVYTAAFTPREYQVELVDAARDRNIIVCLGKTLSRDFIALKLIQEHARDVRRSLDNGGKRSIYLVEESRVRAISALLEFLTDLKISSHSEIGDIDWDVEFREKEVFVMTSQICLDLVLCDYVRLEKVNLLIIDDCHQAVDSNHPIAQLMEQYSTTCLEEGPRIVGLTGPLYTTGCYGGVLAATLKTLENTLKCEVETASDVVSVLRYTTKPVELLVECAEPYRDSLDQSIRNEISSIKYWLEDHRFAQHEYYPPEFFEELKAIPHPNIEPLRLIDDFLSVLDELGPWGANRAAIYLLSQIDKLKVKTAFERHFLLLQMLFSSLVIIHQKCELEFQNCSSEINKVLNYSTPKVLRLLEVIKMYQPDKSASTTECNISQKMNGNSLRREMEETSSKSKYFVNNIEINKDCDYAHSANDKIKTENIKENCQNMSTSELKSDFKEDVFKETKENLINDLVANIKSPLLMEQLREINKCNFTLLTQTMEKMCNSMSDEELSVSHIIKEMKKMVVSKTVDSFNLKSTNDKDSKESSDSGIDAMSSPKMNVLSGPYRNLRGDSNYRRGTGRNRRGGSMGPRGSRYPYGLYHTIEPDALCGIIFVKKPFVAKVLYGLIFDLSKADENYSFLNAQFTVQKTVDPITESREAEIEHRKQEEVLKRFRMHECNLLIGTSVLEQGIDLPRCNLIVHWDEPRAFCNYAHCKGRARAPGALYVNLVSPENSGKAVTKLAEYMEIEKMLLSKCRNTEPPELEEKHADMFTSCIQSYCPTKAAGSPSVNLSTAVALVNKYCAKLPSDTFTRLTPLWRIYKLSRNGFELYQCILRLPINSPTKHDVIGIPMPTRVLARRIVAFQTCIMLHKSGELDDNLQPIGKEGFKVQEEWEISDVEEDICRDDVEPRPGTTKRRQYYYKKVAHSLSNCRPLPGKPCYFYQIHMSLTCPLPEEQNTRGRQIYAPEDSPHGFGILTLKPIPKVGSFPIFTRSGEVSVSLRIIDDQVIMTQDQIKKIYTFINYTFTSVLRLQKHFMMFGPELSDNCFFIVPSVRDVSGQVFVDWTFLDTIEMTDKTLSEPVANEVCKDEQFHPELYNDAVVMPWYRNQDTPQVSSFITRNAYNKLDFFYVAKICTDLNPLSPFPGEQFTCFEDYYDQKYSIKVKNLGQPLLDVDHTSGRLNFLTPRYVNRKGVALPTSSEETKRAKREDLGNKQILIPELCIIHPFPGALWRAAVCLPCILYRINGLLIADQIRRTVALEIGLGTKEIVTESDWPRLDFGWSLAEIFQKASEKNVRNADGSQSELTAENDNPATGIEENMDELYEEEIKIDLSTTDDEENSDDEKNDKNDLLEIGTWSNEMADFSEFQTDFSAIRYGSPTFGATYSDSDTDSYMSSDSDEESDSSQKGGLRIEFKGDNLAEAVETDSENVKNSMYKTLNNKLDLTWKAINTAEDDTFSIDYKESINSIETHIYTSGILVKASEQIPIRQKIGRSNTKNAQSEYNPLLQELLPYQNNVNENSLTIEKIETINNSYISTNGLDVINLVHLADFYEGINNINNMSSFKNKIKSLETEIELDNNDNKFSFDYQPDLQLHPGPSPSIVLQALTMSNANDGINLERLETIGDSFLKYAITTYLYCTYDNIHEGKLSHLRSMQVSNLHLYRLGRRKNLGDSMIATKFEPHDNWLPPCFYVPRDLEDALLAANFPPHCWDMNDLPSMQSLPREELMRVIRQRAIQLGFLADNEDHEVVPVHQLDNDNVPCHIPYNLITQHSIPDKSIADCVEALIGAYLIECGPRGALLFMSWLGIRVLPVHEVISKTKPNEFEDEEKNNKITGFTAPVFKKGVWVQNCFGTLQIPRSPLLRNIVGPEECLEVLLDGYETFEEILGYRFIDRAYLLQAMTHASYAQNRLTDCYQRLEFLGDAVLDYLITRNLYDSPMKHSPGALTDLRSALVNNTIFASLAVRHNFHKYFRHMSPPLQEMIDRFVQIQEANNHAISEEYYLLGEDECAEVEDVEVPKALGDVFESVAGAIYLDSNMSLDTVWKVYYAMMKKELIQFSNSVPKSPIRELLEMEPETAKFGKPEKLADGRRVRVTVEVFGKGSFKGIGRNYRIAKCTAAKCALKKLKANKKQR